MFKVILTNQDVKILSHALMQLSDAMTDGSDDELTLVYDEVRELSRRMDLLYEISKDTEANDNEN